MDSVIGYNDPSAIGAVTAARGAGKKLTAIGLNGTSDGIAGVRNGQLAATVQGQSPGLGIQAVTAAYDLITKQHLPLPKVIVMPPRIVTKANVDKIQDWNAQLARSSSASPGARPPAGPTRTSPPIRWPFRPPHPCQQPRSSVPSGVHKRYGGVHALRGAGLAVYPGRGARARRRERLRQVDAAEDPLGAGAAGQRRDHARGRADAPSATRPTRSGSGIATVTQETTLAPDLSIAENVFLGHRMAGAGGLIDWRADAEAGPRRRSRGSASTSTRRCRSRRLRPDQQQMVEIARALSIDARVLILDEPTSSLTDDEVESLFARRPPPPRRGRRRDLRLPPAERDLRARRPDHGAARRAHRRRRPCRPSSTGRG